MLRADTVEALLTPVSESMPSGPDLEYDPDFMALESLARPVAEQQFGDTVIPAVEPDWRTVSEQAQALLLRTKDVRVAMLALRAATRLDGFSGFSQGAALLLGLLQRFWDSAHPQLDADDHNDPTMRINALAPLVDLGMVLHDVQEAAVGATRAAGVLRVRDIAIAYNRLSPRAGETPQSLAQVEGALGELQASQPDLITAAQAVVDQVDSIHALVTEKTGRADLLDLKPLHDLAALVRQACRSVAGPAATAHAGAEDGAAAQAPASTGTAPAAASGDIRSREDALRQLDRVIDFLQRTEPGNPAPLLIERAKRLVGVSFMDIMADLAPDAVSTIQNITGRPPSDYS
jgi:type VI secretion system protein ImpA